MADPIFREQQSADRYAPRIAPINEYIDELRSQGRGWLPYVAPLHGGTDTQVLSILRDPGPATQDTVGSGFLCVENSDGSAELHAALLQEADFAPRALLPWNAYPWYINHAPKIVEVDTGVPKILRLLELAPGIRVVLLQGGEAWKAWERVLRLWPTLEKERGLATVKTYHPSP